LKPILFVAVAVGLAVYAIDCGAITTPEQSMQCCDTMPCSSHGHEHSQDCCKTMQSMHAPFVQPALAQGLSFSPIFVAVPPEFSASRILDSSSNVLTAHCHAPPIPQATALSPLRI
jgi:hypothetical protein